MADEQGPLPGRQNASGSPLPTNVFRRTRECLGGGSDRYARRPRHWACRYGWFEAGWVRLGKTMWASAPAAEARRAKGRPPLRLPSRLPSGGTRAVRRAVDWVVNRQPDLTVISGDLLSRRSGEPLLRELLARLPNAYAVLGNHDHAITKDPFAQRVDLADLTPARLLVDDAETVELRGLRVQVVGVDPRSYRVGLARPDRLADPDADLRILLCHFPAVIDRLEPGVFDLLFAGHPHAGQICLPYPGGKLRFSHIRWTYVESCTSVRRGCCTFRPG
jgi:predicted phosphodiesterase